MIKKIENFNNYTISDGGVIKNIQTGYIKQPWTAAVGYKYVDLYHNGENKKIAVHRLLAIHFIPNPENKEYVNHIDGDKLNNSLENLEWTTPSENNQHAYDTKLKIPVPRKLTDIEANHYFLDYIMHGVSITELSNTLCTGLTQLSYRIKEAANRLNMEKEYKEELKRQRVERLRKRAY